MVFFFSLCGLCVRVNSVLVLNTALGSLHFLFRIMSRVAVGSLILLMQ